MKSFEQFINKKRDTDDRVAKKKTLRDPFHQMYKKAKKVKV
jgi:hypothetical protein